ncbi:MAG: hypothetical protein MJ162_07625 [Treponema sp.]|nr:hypothetical protein [Treponema sp.]
MYRFILKKNFCDTWDNLLGVIVTNALYVCISAALLYLWAVITKAMGENANVWASMGMTLGLITLWNIIHAIISLAYGEIAVDIANFQAGSIVGFFKAIPGCLLDGLLYGLFVSVWLYISAFCMYYYLGLGSTLGLLLCAFIFWIDIFVALSLQYFVPIRSTMHNNFLKVLKKCFFMFFDNTGFTILLAINNLFLFLLSIVFFGFIPSVGSIIINLQNNFRIRLYKYDYLEQHPELKTKKERKQIPWEELIYEDRETLGPRTFRSFLFPWKE